MFTSIWQLDLFIIIIIILGVGFLLYIGLYALVICLTVYEFFASIFRALFGQSDNSDNVASTDGNDSYSENEAHYKGNFLSNLSEQKQFQITYVDGKGEETSRKIAPYGFKDFDDIMLECWCYKRADFRTFRIDRIKEGAVLDS